MVTGQLLDTEQSESESDDDWGLRKYCNHANSGDGFVGIKIDYAEKGVKDEKIEIIFPVGYSLSESDDKIRLDIQNLMRVLSSNPPKEEVGSHVDKLVQQNNRVFPINSYMTVIEYFLNHGYYVETDPTYKTSTRGKIDWARTVRKQTPIIQKTEEGLVSFVYTNFTVRSSTPDNNKLITHINRYCVYKAFEKFGWLYGSFLPNKPGYVPEKNTAIAVLNSKISSTFNDKKKNLFSAMLEIIMEEGQRTSARNFRFGTNTFSSVWEKMVDKAFGNITGANKRGMFPRATWNLEFETDKMKDPLEPDSLMNYADKIYVLDSKYYTYGHTQSKQTLPASADINKQITYAEVLENKHGKDANSIFNAFIMPFDMEDNRFGLTDFIGRIGEAKGDWRENTKNYERIQGIVIDTRYLMYNYWRKSASDKETLANCIEAGFTVP
jgi:hypothetical protein